MTQTHTGRAARRVIVPRQWSLSTRLIVAGLVLVGVTLLLTLASYRRAVEERRRAEVANALVIAQTMSSAAESFGRDIEGTVTAVSLILSGQDGPGSQAQAGPSLRAIFEDQGQLRTLFLTDATGRVVASYSGRDIGRDLSDRPYLRALVQGRRTVWSGRLAGAQSGQVTVAYGSALRHSNGIRGYVVAAFYPGVVFERLPLSVPPDARITLLDHNGALLYTNQESALRGRIDFSQAPDIRRALSGETVVLRTRRGAVSGEARYGAIVPVARTGWVMSFTRPLAPLETTLRDEFFRQAAGLALAFLLAGVALVFAVNRILRPVMALSRVSSAIARGDRPTVPAVSGPPEVRQLAEGMAAMSQAVAQREEALQRAAAHQQFLADASVALASSLDAETTLKHAARLVVPTIADWCVVQTVDKEGILHRVEVAHTDAALEGRVKAFADRYPPDPDNPRAPTTHVLRTGQSILMEEITDDWLRAVVPDEEAYAFLQELDLQSLVVVPLRARERIGGAITMVMSDSGRHFDRDDLALAEELARRIALAVDNARLYHRERTIAQTLQQASLPRDLPAVPGVALQSAYLAVASSSEIGGDWYDAFWLRDGRIAVSIGDVAGRGLEAAVAMGQIRHGLRMAAFEDARPSTVLARVDNLLGSSLPDEMVTAVFGIIDPSARTFTFANAGHPPPVLGTVEDRIDVLEGYGPPLGFMRARERANIVVPLDPGGLLILYTDGLIELQRDPLRGQQRLLEAMRDEIRSPSDDRAGALLQRVLGGAGPLDDIALLSVSFAREPVDRFDLTLPAIPSALPLVRQSVRQLCQLLDLSAARGAELEIAVGEAVNNAIEHAYGVVPGVVRVRGSVEGGALVITITDQGRWRPPTTSHTGRGLLIMRSLADEASVEPHPVGTSVRLVVRLASEATLAT